MASSLGWWFDEQGRNNLSGVPGSPTNPAILPDHIIVEFLLQYPPAKEEFKKLVPLMLPEEQDRLNALVAANPLTLKNYPTDDQVIDDQFMRAVNSGPIRDPNRRRK